MNSSLLKLNPSCNDMMATAARVQVMQKIIELVDFPVEFVGGESIFHSETELAGRFAEAQRLFSEFTASFNEPLLRYFPVPPPATVIAGTTTTDVPPPPPPPPPPKEETGVVKNIGEIDSSDQKRTARSVCSSRLMAIRTGFVAKRKRTRKLSEIYKDCGVGGGHRNNKLPRRVNRKCKAAAVEIVNQRENSLNINSIKSTGKKKKPSARYVKNKLGTTCSYCKSSRTPMWREGPAGPKSLCNACGLRLKKWGCLDPAAQAQ